MNPPDLPEPVLPQHDGGPPVFNCIVYVSGPDTDGQHHARAAEWNGLASAAASERDAIRQVVRQFKQKAAACVQAGESLPLEQPTPPPQPGESARFIPVHL